MQISSILWIPKNLDQSPQYSMKMELPGGKGNLSMLCLSSFFQTMNKIPKEFYCTSHCRIISHLSTANSMNYDTQPKQSEVFLFPMHRMQNPKSHLDLLLLLPSIFAESPSTDPYKAQLLTNLAFQQHINKEAPSNHTHTTQANTSLYPPHRPPSAPSQALPFLTTKKHDAIRLSTPRFRTELQTCNNSGTGSGFAD